MRAQWVLRGSDGLMSPAIPGDGRERSGSGETQARPKATGLMIDKHALVHYLNEKSFLLRTNRRNLAGELVDDGAERRASAAGGGRRGHGLLAQRQSSVRLLWPLHDLVRLAVGENFLILVSS